MHSVLLIFPGFILSLSLFHFSVIVHRFQMGFELLTPSVIHRYLHSEIQGDTLIFWLDPMTVSTGIEDFLARQFFDEKTPYIVTFQFFQEDQLHVCFLQCKGVLTTLEIRLQWSPITFSRHYQLVMQ